MVTNLFVVEEHQKKIYANPSNWSARIAQLVANPLGTREVPGSNPGTGENFSVKINNKRGLRKIPNPTST